MSDKQLRFQVGDQLASLTDFSYWTNIYHFGKFERSFPMFQEVKSANEKYFTTRDGINLENSFDLSDHDKQRHIYRQEDGRSVDLYSQIHNWTRNKENIILFFERNFKKEFERCDEEDTQEILRLENEISQKKRQIEKIKAGKRALSYSREHIERDFLNDRITFIRSVIEKNR